VVLIYARKLLCRRQIANCFRTAQSASRRLLVDLIRGIKVTSAHTNGSDDMSKHKPSPRLDSSHSTRSLFCLANDVTVSETEREEGELNETC
jgi:hypothetical protein